MCIFRLLERASCGFRVLDVEDLPAVGDAVLAATGMEESVQHSGSTPCGQAVILVRFQETSFLCDSADLSALRKQLGDDGSDEDSSPTADGASMCHDVS